ncbi:MAG: MSHA pilin protein MshA [Glaciecola sp.]|jgi:MSHA pilin protein MshA
MHKTQKGFTVVELIVVIVIIGILAVVSFPKLLSLSADAKVTTLKQIKTQLRSSISLVQNKARLKGLKAETVNPGAGQTNYLIDFGFGSSELMFSNLCPESIAEMGTRMRLLDFMNVTLTDDITVRVDNRYTLLGYDVPASGTPTNQGCYILYDSFATPNCTLTLVTDDCQ